ncbi:MAG: DUF1549 and DUF1553 domain-containing protein [Limisphaerales bacterium]
MIARTLLLGLLPLMAVKGIDAPDQRWAAEGRGGEPSFSKHVVPLLNKVGCSARECHGAFQGQNGFRLSLFGYDLNLDHEELTHDKETGPRVNINEPDRSLALRKPLDEIDHEGGRKIRQNTWQHRLLREWITAGAKFDPDNAATVRRLEIIPAEIHGTPATLQVRATFNDDTREDVTALTHFSSNDAGVAKVDKRGRVTITGTGDTALVITFAGAVQAIPVISPRPDKSPSPDFAEFNPIDHHVAGKLRKLNIQPSELCDDKTFIRRAFVDCIGTLPQPDEIEAFLKAPANTRRSDLIDQLLERPEYALYWATHWSDWTGNNRSTLNPNFKTSWLWYDWFKNKLQRNVPYDQLVKGIVTATSREGRSLDEYEREVAQVYARMRPDKGRKNGFDDGTYGQRKTLDLYWMKRGGGPEEMAIRTANTFLGVQIQCAQCHKHPFDRWTESDFNSWQSFFMVTNVLATDGGKRGNRLDYHTVAVYPGPYRGNARQLEQVPPRLLAGPVAPYVKDGKDPRVDLWEWMVAPENPWFARNIVNRIWGHYFGMGIVDPIDDFNAANPPSNPALLDWLAKDFRQHGFDLKHLHRRIMNSRTYQLSHLPNDSNRHDRRNFSHAHVRRLHAEVLVDAIDDITGVPTRYSSTFVPPNTRAIGIAPTSIGRASAEYVFHIFGRPKRIQTCACERSTETGLVQALYLLNDTDLLEKISHADGRAAELADSKKSEDGIIDELYLRTLARPPSKIERRNAKDHFAADGISRSDAVEDLMWTLFNVREFVFVK